MEGAKTKAIRSTVTQLCDDVSQQSGALVDAFDIPESCLAPIIKD